MITREIHEYVPGKQITLAHIMANPAQAVCTSLGLEDVGAIGVLTLTPGETSIIAGDIAIKAAGVHIGFLDRFSGTLILYGPVGDVEQAMRTVVQVLQDDLKYNACALSRY